VTDIADREQQAIETVYEELAGEQCIPIKLRRGEGLDEAALNRVRQSLILLTELWKHMPYVPKRIAAAFVDIQSSMEWGRDQYSEGEQQRIEDAAIELVSLANDLFEDERYSGQ
jgi:hypothetical protein